MTSLVIASQRVGAKGRPMTGSAKQSRIFPAALDRFAEPVIGRPFAPTRWLAMTTTHTEN